jgi:protein tyrosine/serine phosphatase
MRNRARQLTSERVFAALISFSVVVICQTSVSAGQGQEGKFGNIKIKNFGQMDERLYRGAQPNERDYKDLAALGINTVVDLRNDPESYAKKAAEELGMHYINIPMSDKSYPKDEQIETFLKIVNDPATGKLFVHCAGGRHRTGVIGAIYRYKIYNWDYEQVYKEMKAFDFYTRWGHGAMKDYVQDFRQRNPGKDIVVSTDK